VLGCVDRDSEELWREIAESIDSDLQQVVTRQKAIHLDNLSYVVVIGAFYRPLKEIAEIKRHAVEAQQHGARGAQEVRVWLSRPVMTAEARGPAGVSYYLFL